MQIKDQIEDLIKHYYSQKRKPQFVLGKTRIPLNIPSYDWEEVCDIFESQSISKLLIFHNRIFAISSGGRLLRVNSDGDAWEEVSHKQ